MTKTFSAPLLLALGLLALLSLAACSTTEQQVDNLIEQLAATPIDSDPWKMAVEGLAALGRPAGRQLIAHIDPDFYKGENYREYRDEIEKIRTGCAQVLGRIKHRAATATLKDRITTAYRLPERLACIWAVGELGQDQAAMDALKVQVRDPNPQIRLCSAIALIKMNDSTAVQEIIDAIQGEDRGLAQMARRELEGTNYFGVPFLVKLVQQPGPQQSQIQAVQERIKQCLIEQLKDEDPDIRLHSARALGTIGDPGVAGELVALLKDANNLVRFNAAASLAEMSQSSGIEFLFSALVDEDPILRVHAVTFLTQVQRTSRTVETQLLAALQHDNPLARSGAAQVLGQAQVGMAVPSLIEAAQDPVPAVRWNAIIALGYIRAPQSRPQLESLLEDSDPTVTYYAAWALQQLSQTSSGVL